MTFDPACMECGGACCQSVSLPMPPPPLVQGALDYLKVRGRVRDQRWIIPSPCRHLTPDGACGTWDTRPKPCADMVVGGKECRDAIAWHLEDSHAHRVYALLPKAP